MSAQTSSEVTSSSRSTPIFSRVIEPESYVGRLNLAGIFGRHAPLHVDLGCGDGSFLCEIARRSPEKNFLGIERMLGRIRSAERKAGQVDNARVLRMESTYAVRYLLPAESVERFYLLFPDPWPKRRHQTRRVFTSDFLDGIRGALTNDGTFHIATDQQDYFEQIKLLAGSGCDFSIAEPQDVDLPQTKFQKRFQEQGLPIYRLELRKVSPVV